MDEFAQNIENMSPIELIKNLQEIGENSYRVSSQIKVKILNDFLNEYMKTVDQKIQDVIYPVVKETLEKTHSIYTIARNIAEAFYPSVKEIQNTILRGTMNTIPDSVLLKFRDDQCSMFKLEREILDMLESTITPLFREIDNEEEIMMNKIEKMMNSHVHIDVFNEIEEMEKSITAQADKYCNSGETVDNSFNKAFDDVCKQKKITDQNVKDVIKHQIETNKELYHLTKKIEESVQLIEKMKESH
jgi:hypothetical protein